MKIIKLFFVLVSIGAFFSLSSCNSGSSQAEQTATDSAKIDKLVMALPECSKGVVESIEPPAKDDPSFYIVGVRISAQLLNMKVNPNTSEIKIADLAFENYLPLEEYRKYINNLGKENTDQSGSVSIDEFETAPNEKSQYGCNYALNEDRMNVGKYICCQTDGGVILNINGVSTKFTNKKDEKGEWVIGKYINDNYDLVIPLKNDTEAPDEPGTGILKLTDKSGKTIEKQVYFVCYLP